MNSMLIGVAIVAVFAVTGALGWPYDDQYSAWRLARTARRSHVSNGNQCSGVGGKCFSTQQCCKRFVCAAFDDYYGMKPEVPGFCVKEKDLQSCYSSRDCEAGARCVALGRDGENYCVSRQGADEVEREQQVLEQAVNSGPKVNYQTSVQRGSGKLGSSCSQSSQCQAFDKSGNQLCCQSVRRGRQGTRQLCDRMTQLSECLD